VAGILRHVLRHMPQVAATRPPGVDDHAWPRCAYPDRAAGSQRRQHHLPAATSRGHHPPAMGPVAQRPCLRQSRTPCIDRVKLSLGPGRTVDRGQFRCSGCHRLIQLNLLVLLDGPSRAEMEPEVGFEPTTLRVGPYPSAWTRPDPSWLLRSGTDSI
jgi:hypothetical protein